MKIDLTKTLSSLQAFANQAASTISGMVVVKSGNLKSSINGAATATDKKLEAGVEAEEYIENQKNKAEIDAMFIQKANSYVNGQFNTEVVDIINEAVLKTLKKK